MDTLNAIFNDLPKTQRPTPEQFLRIAKYLESVIKSSKTSDYKRTKALQYILIPENRRSGTYQRDENGKVQTAGQENYKILMDFLGVKDFPELLNIMNDSTVETNVTSQATPKSSNAEPSAKQSTGTAPKETTRSSEQPKTPEVKNNVDSIEKKANDYADNVFIKLDELFGEFLNKLISTNPTYEETVRLKDKAFTDLDIIYNGLEVQSKSLIRLITMYLSSINNKAEILLTKNRVPKEEFESQLSNIDTQINKIKKTAKEIIVELYKQKLKSPETKSKIAYNEALQNASQDTKSFMNGLFDTVTEQLMNDDVNLDGIKNARFINNDPVNKFIDKNLGKYNLNIKKELQDLAVRFKTSKEAEYIILNAPNKGSIEDYNSLLESRSNRVYTLATEILKLLESSKNQEKQKPKSSETKIEFPTIYRDKKLNVRGGEVLEINIKGYKTIELPIYSPQRFNRSGEATTLDGIQNADSEEKTYPLRDGNKLKVKIEGGEVTFRSIKPVEFDVKIIEKTEDNIGTSADQRKRMIDNLG